MDAFIKVKGMEKGFSMIEVLVTLVILLVGLLGLAGMMMKSQRAETESYQRAQALLLLQDMVGRINANRKVASCYATSDGASGTPYLGTGVNTTATPPTCTSGTTEQQATAIQDMKDWNDMLKGSAELSGINKVGAMIGARGCVSFDAAANVYRISVAWQGLGDSVAPPSAVACGKNQYNNENHRRVVSTTLQIATLSL
ncbi:type IV pilus modification protein PilV [Noviherbaspirillum sedimenti]|uniref:Type IV pilus modification protein PilV n=1 Tax=Noviherbaspirillum sedimenti TaxID=2320865 RepID=A0A3A3GBD3_9BURK|nr:type IV pilus modification protein PilV [Noviherbaspirillum sedimenti]RJG03972.1 type IV pilus modification protein PilV [Noviherbaspirillum sedimenti]